MKLLERPKYVGHVWLTRNLSKAERQRAADMLSGIAADLAKGAAVGGVMDIEIEGDECEPSES